MNTVLREIRNAFTTRLSGAVDSTRLSGAVDSVMFSDSDLILRWAGIVFESWYTGFSHFTVLFYCPLYLEHFFHYTFFSGLLNVCLIGRLCDRKPN